MSGERKESEGARTTGMSSTTEPTCPTGFLTLPSDLTTVSCLNDCTPLSRRGSLHPSEALRYSKWRAQQEGLNPCQLAATLATDAFASCCLTLCVDHQAATAATAAAAVAASLELSQKPTYSPYNTLSCSCCVLRSSAVLEVGRNPRGWTTGLSHCYPTILARGWRTRQKKKQEKKKKKKKKGEERERERDYGSSRLSAGDVYSRRCELLLRPR